MPKANNSFNNNDGKSLEQWLWDATSSIHEAVNRASKTGEDIAASGEVLITKEAMEMIPAEANIKARELKISISGIEIPAFAIEYRRE